MSAPRPRFILRTCQPDGTSRNGFRWPLVVGEVAVAPDWNDRRECGGGLHGPPDGVGDGTLLDWSDGAVWLVAEVPADAGLVDLDGKVKVERCIVAHVGDRVSCAEFLVAQGCDGAIVARTATAGNDGTATAGDGGTATAGYRGTATAGYRGTATAGNDGTATAGDRGTATAGNDGTATAGYGGTATAGYGGTATAGDGGTATAGNDGTATAGNRGLIVILWWDVASSCYRHNFAEVGDGGLKPNTPYRLDSDTHEFVEVEA